MPQTKTIISANNISLNYQNKNILTDVSIDIKADDFITLIGPNGAGKSSLIKILIGLITPDSGSVERSHDIVVGYTPQTFTPNQFIPISAINFLHLNKNTSDKSIKEISELTGVSELLQSPLQSLSGGEMQRLLITRALLNKPDILILDEPAQNLDINAQMRLYKLIESIHNQGCAILMVSHDLHRVMRDSTKVVCLYHHICCAGKPETILKDAQFNDLFADQVAGLMATYEHHHNHSHD